MSVLTTLDPTSLLVGGAVLLCLLWRLSTRRPPGLPPGPGPALPLLRHLHLMPKDPRAQLWTWRRQYGDVFSLYMGGKLVVVLASYSAIREALVTFADVFSDRPHLLIMDQIAKNKGISCTSGPTWKEQRKTSLKILRAMGMGKNVLAEKIQEEITHYIRTIKDHQGAPVDVFRMTQISISNNICSIIWGKRFDYQDPEFISYIECIDRNFKLLSALGSIPGDPFKSRDVPASYDSVFAFIAKHMADHRRSVGEHNQDTEECTDFLYGYLRQMQKAQKADVSTTLDEKNLKMCAADLFLAGTETTSTAILWALLFFLHHPHVQDTCFQEISDVVGPDRLPAMSDRPKLPYLEATTWEVLRKGDVVPLSVWHASAADVTFRGYVIPKDTIITPDLNCVLQDPEIWGDPENFRPERFIDFDGKLTRPEEFVPFSMGRRVCLGESLARMELFLYLATLIQHFRFLPPEEGKLPSLEGTFGMTYTPQAYTIRAVPRM
ncbi:cytochrome P450 2U1-like isoform X2 [Babylonia areolata]|uniref:cytochrome P450 2U1-like isoform X2 n=1 Tax=Babylonia areolata TaxID=304850 RepID=UPI003FD3CA2D